MREKMRENGLTPQSSSSEPRPGLDGSKWKRTTARYVPLVVALAVVAVAALLGITAELFIFMAVWLVVRADREKLVPTRRTILILMAVVLLAFVSALIFSALGGR